MNVFETLHNHKNEKKAKAMAAYMKNKFPFLGIQTPLRKALTKTFIKEK